MLDRRRLTGGFRLREWTVKPEDGSLTAPHATVRLEPLLMDLLVFLSSKASQVISKEQILDSVWKGRFVSDESIKGSFHQLRKALGDDPRKPQFIETIPKRGYRVLIEPVPLNSDNYYEKGRAALAGEPSPTSLKQARLYLERALEDDPDHSAALAALARTYGLLIAFGLAPGSEFWTKAKAAALRANQLDSELADAHLALALVLAVHDHDIAGAERESRLALGLNSADAVARRWRVRLLSCLAAHTEALEEIRRLVDSDPLSVPTRRDLIEILFMARRYEDAIAEADRLSEFAPAAADVQLGMVWLYCVQNKPHQAFTAFLTGLKSLNVSPVQIEHAKWHFAEGGLAAILRLWVALLEQQAAIGQPNQNDLIALYALLDEKDRAFALMEAAFEEGNPWLLWLPVSPLLDNLRSDPRYQGLLVRLGFA